MLKIKIVFNNGKDITVTQEMFDTIMQGVTKGSNFVTATQEETGKVFLLVNTKEISFAVNIEATK